MICKDGILLDENKLQKTMVFFEDQLQGLIDTLTLSSLCKMSERLKYSLFSIQIISSCTHFLIYREQCKSCNKFYSDLLYSGEQGIFFCCTCVSCNAIRSTISVPGFIKEITPPPKKKTKKKKAKKNL